VPGRAAFSATIFERFYSPHRNDADPGPRLVRAAAVTRAVIGA
jgi:hypothetical protein